MVFGNVFDIGILKAYAETHIPFSVRAVHPANANIEASFDISSFTLLQPL